MSTSGTHNFRSLQNNLVLDDAFERLGSLPDLTTQQKITTATRSLNIILTRWMNKGLNLFTVQQEVLALNQNQNTYPLPLATVDVLEAAIRTSTRNLGGTAFSSAGGIAANAFSGNPALACTQNAPDGYISYNWGQQVYSIAMVGIQSNATLTYTLTFEYSNDNITWNSVYSPIAQTFTAGTLIWFVVPVPTPGTYFRVRETDGATLNIQELYFNTALYDSLVTRVSRAEWVSYPQKNQTSRPTSFWVDRQVNPSIILWPTPTAEFTALYYTRTVYVQDAGSLINNLNIPQNFIPALVSALAYDLSHKFDTDLNKAQMLKAQADEDYGLVASEDTERVPLRIYGDFTQGWGSV
jgi:hypothetical protein